MALLDLKTDLKSLKFGTPPASDRPGGGNSGQPYITDPISSDIIPQSEDFLLKGGLNAPLDAANDVIRLTKFFGDLKSPRGVLFVAKQNILSRIGVATQASGKGVNEGVYTPLTTLAQAGVGFTGAHLYKQGLNPLSGVKTYGPKSLFNPQGSTVIGDVIGNTDGTGNRLVNLYNTQIPNPGNDFSIENIDNIYSYSGGPGSELGIGETNIRFATDNRGAPLLSGVATKDYQAGIGKSGTDRSTLPPSYSPLTSNGITKTFNTTSYPQFTGMTVGLNDGNNGGFGRNFEIGVYETGSLTPRSGLDTYQKGLKYSRFPLNEEPLGVSTRYNSYLNITPLFPPLTSEGGLTWELNGTKTSVYENGSFKNTGRIYDNSSKTLTQDQIENISLETSQNKTLPGSTIVDFRKPLIDNLSLTSGIIYGTTKASTIMSIAPNYSNDLKILEGNETSRINFSSPGQSGNVLDYEKGKTNVLGKTSVVDKINFQPLYKSSNVRSDEEVAKNDLVKFRIGAVLRDEKKVYMHFRAFINKFSDSYSAKWSGTQYMGRGEEFYKYGGFGRTISLSYTVAAQSKPELMAQYKKLNFLASTLAPDYGGNGYMGGVLTTLTLGGWCYELPGFIDSLSLDIPQESPWEIAIGSDVKEGKGDKTVKEMPHICNVDMKFTPIHTFRPELQDNGYNGSKSEVSRYGNQQYIELTNGATNNYDNAISLADAQKPSK